MIENLEGMMADRNGEPAEGMSNEDLLKIPEARQLLEKTIARHWETWVDIPVPALGNKTPKNAVKTTDGREAVEALLYDAANSNPDPLMKELNKKGVRSVCKILGLDPFKPPG